MWILVWYIGILRPIVTEVNATKQSIFLFETTNNNAKEIAVLLYSLIQAFAGCRCLGWSTTAAAGALRWRADCHLRRTFHSIRCGRALQLRNFIPLLSWLFVRLIRDFQLLSHRRNTLVLLSPSQLSQQPLSVMIGQLLEQLKCLEDRSNHRLKEGGNHVDAIWIYKLKGQSIAMHVL